MTAVLTNTLKVVLVVGLAGLGVWALVAAAQAAPRPTQTDHDPANVVAHVILKPQA